MMRSRTALIVSSAILMGCASAPKFAPLTLRLYDVAQARVLLATASNDGTGHGTIEISLPSGEQAVGEYTTMPGGVTGWGSIYALASTGAGLAAVSGAQTVVAQPNEQQGSFVAVGDRGTAIHCEYLVNPLNHGHGACKDTRGTVYTLLY